jgi:cobalt transporter subunit CbtA
MARSMASFRAIVFSAALAGSIVGGVATAAQHLGTVPLILQAGVFERQAEQPAHSYDAAKPQEPAAHDHGVAAWEPADGLERNAYTALFNIVEWIGFGLLLNGAFVLLGHPVTWRDGFLWGLGGFAAFVMAPGLGLPPELPGVPAAPLFDRQLWWVATVTATAGGLAIVAFRRSPLAAAIGIALIMAPHLVGAPHLAHVETNVPDKLARQFVAVVTMTALPCWALLGALTAQFYRRFSATAETRRVPMPPSARAAL